MPFAPTCHLSSSTTNSHLLFCYTVTNYGRVWRRGSDYALCPKVSSVIFHHKLAPTVLLHSNQLRQSLDERVVPTNVYLLFLSTFHHRLKLRKIRGPPHPVQDADVGACKPGEYTEAEVFPPHVVVKHTAVHPASQPADDAPRLHVEINTRSVSYTHLTLPTNHRV